MVLTAYFNFIGLSPGNVDRILAHSFGDAVFHDQVFMFVREFFKKVRVAGNPRLHGRSGSTAAQQESQHAACNGNQAWNFHDDLLWV